MNKTSAILTEQDFRAAISSQCGFPLQLKDRSVLGLPKTDEQRERDKDLEYESRVDYESWQYDGPADREDS